MAVPKESNSLSSREEENNGINRCSSNASHTQYRGTMPYSKLVPFSILVSTNILCRVSVEYHWYKDFYGNNQVLLILVDTRTTKNKRVIWRGTVLRLA
jgi:hypothetical protein